MGRLHLEERYICIEFPIYQRHTILIFEYPPWSPLLSPLRLPLHLRRLHPLPVRHFALGDGLYKRQQQRPPEGDVFRLWSARDVEKDDLSSTLILGEVRQAREVDEVAQVAPGVLGYPELVVGLVDGISYPANRPRVGSK